MRTALSSLVLLTFLLAACGESLPDVDTIADEMARRAAANFKGVNTFSVEGDGVAIYFKRVAPDSLTTFDFRALTNDSQRQPVFNPYNLPNVAQLARGVRQNARLVGSQERSDGRVLVLEATDPAMFIGATSDTPGETPSSARVVVDAETFQVLEISLETAPFDAASTSPITQRQLYSDFRTVDGLTLPFSAKTIIEGIEVAQEMLMIEGGNLEIARRRASGLPPDKRAAALEEIDNRQLFLETGVMIESFTIELVRVNEGVPEGIF